MIPKHHGAKLTDIPDDQLSEVLVRDNHGNTQIGITDTKQVELTILLTSSQPIAKKLVTATGAQEYNILQNNGRGAHQEVDHVRQLLILVLRAVITADHDVTEQVHFHMVFQLLDLPSRQMKGVDQLT